MACRIRLDTLSEKEKEIIREKLYLQPKRTNFAANKFFGAVEKDPILFYWIDKPNNEIVLPYTFTNALLKRHINSTNIYPSGSFKFTGTLRDYQVPIINDALKQLTEFGTTTLALPTGFGKSIISVVLGSMLMGNGTGGLMLVLVNRETIMKGWHTTILENTNGAGVWVVENKIKIPKTCNIILCMDGRFEKIPWEIRKLVSVLVIDEAHLFCTASQVPVLLGTCPKYIIACSATLERPDDMHRMILNIVGTHKVEVKNEKRFTVYKLCTGIETEYTLNKQGTTNFAQLCHDLSFNPKRNALIVNYVENNSDKKIILLSWSVEHCKFLYDLLKARNHSVDVLAGNKSTYIDSRILIGTVSKISTGFDAKMVAENFDGLNIDTIILCGSTKSHNLHIQSIGRAFRSDCPTIVDVVDNDRISRSHWSARKKNYLELNCDIKEIRVEEKKRETEEITPESLAKIHTERVNALKEKMKIV